ncbi:MAG: hypothetical protein GY927_14785 [bacterium]|nr:hypothetical protein [bacterium]
MSHLVTIARFYDAPAAHCAKSILEADKVPRLVLVATHMKMTEIVPVETLKKYAVDLCQQVTNPPFHVLKS